MPIVRESEDFRLLGKGWEIVIVRARKGVKLLGKAANVYSEGT